MPSKKFVPYGLKLLQTKENLNIFRIVMKMPIEDMHLFDNYEPTNMEDYLSLQRKWLDIERSFLSCESACPIDDQLLIEDFKKNNVGEKYRTFYALKFPDKVKLSSKRESIDELVQKMELLDIAPNLKAPLVRLLQNSSYSPHT